MITKHLTSALIAGIVIASISGFTFADAAEDKGLAIAQQIKLRDEGWIDMTASMNMVLPADLFHGLFGPIRQLGKALQGLWDHGIHDCSPT